MDGETSLDSYIFTEVQWIHVQTLLVMSHVERHNLFIDIAPGGKSLRNQELSRTSFNPHLVFGLR